MPFYQSLFEINTLKLNSKSFKNSYTNSIKTSIANSFDEKISLGEDMLLKVKKLIIELFNIYT